MELRNTQEKQSEPLLFEAALLREGAGIAETDSIVGSRRWPVSVQARTLGAQERRNSMGGVAPHESGGLGFPVPEREREGHLKVMLANGENCRRQRG